MVRGLRESIQETTGDTPVARIDAPAPAHARLFAGIEAFYPPGMVRSLGDALAAAWRRSERKAAMREAERRLRDAPDAILSDIGIRPDDVASAVRHGREHLGWR